MRKTDPFELLRLLYTSGPLSRTDLSEKGGVAASYVSAVIARARASGLISELGLVESARGRRRVLLNINPSLGQLIGVDIGRWHLRIAITDFAGKILDYTCLKSEAFQGKDHVLHLIHDVLERMISQRPEIAGIGVSHSGVIDQHGGKVLFWPQFNGWEDIPIKQIFEQEYGLPTYVEDEVRAMATMEQRFGHGKDVRNFVFVTVAMGIGSAIFVDGHLYTGRDGLAGELGHTTVEKDGKICSCGNRGCLELYSSASAIIGRVRDELEQGVSSALTDEFGGNLDKLSVEKIAAAADSHDRLSERVLSDAGAYLGTALAGVVNLLNPERIVLAGKVPHPEQGIFLASLLYNLRQRAYPQATKHLDVIVSQLGDEAAAVGAVLIAGEEVLKARCREMERAPTGLKQPSTLGGSAKRSKPGEGVPC